LIEKAGKGLNIRGFFLMRLVASFVKQKKLSPDELHSILETIDLQEKQSCQDS